ncbi:hypothetical protein JD969_08310 [Planctomycetota bacterium]|nr:hypothetical protein JD969_08310 [Planctomycetota bacterium]
MKSKIASAFSIIILCITSSVIGHKFITYYYTPSQAGSASPNHSMYSIHDASYALYVDVPTLLYNRKSDHILANMEVDLIRSYGNRSVALFEFAAWLDYQNLKDNPIENQRWSMQGARAIWFLQKIDTDESEEALTRLLTIACDGHDDQIIIALAIMNGVDAAQPELIDDMWYNPKYDPDQKQSRAEIWWHRVGWAEYMSR